MASDSVRLAVDPKSHRRFLDYVEKYIYFGGSDCPKLTREEWQELESERLPLEETAGRIDAPASDRARLRALRRLLLVD